MNLYHENTAIIDVFVEPKGVISCLFGNSIYRQLPMTQYLHAIPLIPIPQFKPKIRATPFEHQVSYPHQPIPIAIGTSLKPIHSSVHRYTSTRTHERKSCRSFLIRASLEDFPKLTKYLHYILLIFISTNQPRLKRIPFQYSVSSHISTLSASLQHMH